MKNHFTLHADLTWEQVDEQELRQLRQGVESSDIRGHIMDIAIAVMPAYRDPAARYALVRNETDGIVAGAHYRPKNVGTPESTTVLYNLFSIASGGGSLAFDAYWQYTVKNTRWFKFFADCKAHGFYSRRGVRYWGLSKTAQTFSCLGRVYDADVVASMEQWHREIADPAHGALTSADIRYLEKNLEAFAVKHAHGVKRAKKERLELLERYIIAYQSTHSTLDL